MKHIVERLNLNKDSKVAGYWEAPKGADYALIYSSGDIEFFSENKLQEEFNKLVDIYKREDENYDLGEIEETMTTYEELLSLGEPNEKNRLWTQLDGPGEMQNSDIDGCYGICLKNKKY